MLKPLSFWIGLLLGLLAASGARRRPRPAPRPSGPDSLPDSLLDLVGEGLLVWDEAGRVTEANAAARALFGPDAAGLAGLRYSSGQPLAPGQLPRMRVLQGGEAIEAAGYLLPGDEGKTRVLDLTARPWGAGGAAAVFKDVTDRQDAQARAAAAAGVSETLRHLCSRLGAATGTEEIARVITEGALRLLDGPPDARVRLYVSEAEGKKLTQLASAPEDRPKRPRSRRQSQAPTFPFDVKDPLLWQVYVARQPSMGAASALGEEDAGAAYALPLLAGRRAVGHLSLSCQDPAALADADRVHALELLASAAALALDGARSAAQARSLATQAAAVRDIAQAVSVGLGVDALADLMAGHFRAVSGAELCTLAVREGDALRLRGDYRDALLLPERTAPGDPALVSEALEDALRGGKTVQRLGTRNPALEDGPWRAFAGRSGRHSVLAVPLPGGGGGWTAYWSGEAPMPEADVRMLETLAALTAAAMFPAARTGG